MIAKLIETDLTTDDFMMFMIFLTGVIVGIVIYSNRQP